MILKHFRVYNIIKNFTKNSNNNFNYNPFLLKFRRIFYPTKVLFLRLKFLFFSKFKYMKKKERANLFNFKYSANANKINMLNKKSLSDFLLLFEFLERKLRLKIALLKKIVVF